ncbi:MAG: 16S rRNA (cytosine(1402)-N(4))-methyltransferase RsmH [Acidimicrobiia bacterium]|nr:16S rRNA (cytosine(1402)-N(4))-methyltransferase RsmH [Acidimicrobiia bacterium]
MPVVIAMEPATEFNHDPVMVSEIVEIFGDAPTGVIADLTLGGAGHAARLLESAGHLQIHGFDRDDAALAAAEANLSPFVGRSTLHKTRFDAAASLLRNAGVEEISGFLMDLGVSSPQLDWADRGFSYRLDGPLDMRMDPQQKRTAADIVNEYEVGELIDVLQSYGDERHAARIARAIVAHRPVASTTALAEIIANAIPAAARRKSTGHPAKRSFQAIRIEVNDELTILGDTVDSMIEMLAPGGVGLVLTYHSGEDRIVKDRMRSAIEGKTLPGMPSTTGFEWLWRGARTASDAELETNPRARSARLRAITRRASA